jgi:hypothetical protein
MQRSRAFTLLLGLLVGLGGLFATPGRCLACSCALPSNPAEARDRVAAVFQARVIAINQEVGTDGRYLHQRVTLQVSMVWKGMVARETTLYTGSGGGDCGYQFQLDHEYVIYAYITSANGSPQSFPTNALTTGICSGTKPMAQAGDDLLVLGAGSAPADTALPNLPNTGAGYASRLTMSVIAAVLALIVMPALLLGLARLRQRMT